MGCGPRRRADAVPPRGRHRRLGGQLLLAALASAAFAVALQAQDSTRVTSDSIARDSIARDSIARDSIARDSIARDSIARDTTPVVASDSARAPIRNRPVADECAAPRAEWIFCDDFESDRTARYFEYDARDSSFRRTPGVGVLGSEAMRAHFDSGQVSAGSLKLAFGRVPIAYMHPVDSGTTTYRDIYWRVYVRTDSTWTGGGGDKLSRAQSLVSEKWAQAMGAPVWSGSNADAKYLVIDPYSGTDASGTLVATTYNDFTRLRWLGAARSVTPIFDAAHAGQWYCIEAHARLADPGASNGVFELWIDDWLEARRDHLAWRGSDSTGTQPAYGINTVFLENYWNAGSPASQSRYFDNFVVSTRRIGCGRLTPP